MSTHAGTYSLEINVVSELHVLRVNAENLQAPSWVGNADVDLTIKATKATERRVNGVGPVCCSHNNDIGASLETVHKCKQLRDHSALDLAVRLLV
jgi:hypothetical protein